MCQLRRAFSQPISHNLHHVLYDRMTSPRYPPLRHRYLCLPRNYDSAKILGCLSPRIALYRVTIYNNS
ncbi:hypothetical protein B5X24_HaOG213691 [Helicoverpa armigera]|uniref:Uncharacterized protein n=1 Tax=Helicoverpa armigera TaxID=29058 RepID=A0A2W1BAJ1_HELAM|nr:hypothetical protein B5X24_HaOG213691 [Helicoverpa armigera]